jgi:acyl-CoA thioester hydrolase
MSVNEGNELVGEIELAPAFHDCDPMNVVWHGNYFKYFEIARCALLKRYDYDYPQMLESGYLWPVVDARVKYVRPLLFGQALRVRSRIVEWENRLKIEYEIVDAESGQVLTRAMTIQVAVDAASKEMLYQCPRVLWQRLGVPAP